MALRIEHISEEVGLPETELLQLFWAAFGAVDALWPANQRWLLWAADKLVGHASVQRRWFILKKRYFEGWMVGGVCVDPVYQKSGLGTLLMRQAHTDLASQTLDFAVLNCGATRVSFYEHVGYVKVSDRALYLRGGELAFDEDPALAISFNKAFDVTTLLCSAFPFGFDF